MNEVKSLTVEEMWSQEKSLAFIKSQVAPTLSQEEWQLFVGIGRNTGTNPLLREIWAVKYGNKCSIFIGRDGYRKSAQKHPDYDSHSVFSVYTNDKLEPLPDGTYRLTPNLKERGTLIGAIAWCKRKGSSMVNCGGLVKLSEYDTGMSNWKKMKDTMIKKVAEAQVLRQTFQELFAGTYDESEQGAVEQTVIEGIDEKTREEILAIKTIPDLQKYSAENRGKGKEFDKLIVCQKAEIEKSGETDPDPKPAKKPVEKKPDGEMKVVSQKGVTAVEESFLPDCKHCGNPSDAAHEKDCPNFKK